MKACLTNIYYSIGKVVLLFCFYHIESHHFLFLKESNSNNKLFLRLKCFQYHFEVILRNNLNLINVFIPLLKS